jgi:hypothetical protein
MRESAYEHIEAHRRILQATGRASPRSGVSRLKVVLCVVSPTATRAPNTSTRDPVVLDFVQLADGAKERDLEAALLEDIERFMLALGEGFYFAGRQKSLLVGGEEFILDLLFFHHPTRRFLVIDLKLGPFKAEFVGKMNLYVNAVDGASRMRWRGCGAWSSRSPSSPPAERTSWQRTIDA